MYHTIDKHILKESMNTLKKTSLRSRTHNICHEQGIISATHKDAHPFKASYILYIQLLLCCRGTSASVSTRIDVSPVPGEFCPLNQPHVLLVLRRFDFGLFLILDYKASLVRQVCYFTSPIQAPFKLKLIKHLCHTS